MEKIPVSSYRVAYENWFLEDRFESLLRLLKQYAEPGTRVALFTSITHPPLALAELKKRTEIMADRIIRIKSRGFSCGINILGTIGHHNEDLEHQLREPWARMTNNKGETCLGSYCMNDQGFLNAYIRPAYSALSAAKPDFIWIDDDVRYGHMPIGNGCFCDNCVEIFNKECGASYTRETLAEALEKYDVELRHKWLTHQSETIKRLFSVIRETVPAEIKLGFMTGERYFEGYDFAGFADVLSDSGRLNIMWRPGGGAYTDRSLEEFIGKADEIGRQCAYLPGCVNEIHSEIENFPYNLLKKSPESTAVEAALYIASGCTGSAFNIFPSETLEPLETIEPLLKAIFKYTPFYSLMSKTFGLSKAMGVHTGWATHSQAAADRFASGNGGKFASYADEIFALGLPMAYAFDKASMYTLSGKGAYALTRDGIMKILTKGAYIDADALDVLNALGYSEYTGFTSGRRFDRDAREEYLENALNAGFVHHLRNCRQAFNSGLCAELIPASGAEVLCRLVDYHGAELSPCSVGLYKNSLGGLICAAGYYPFSWVSDYQKTVQLKRIFNQIADNSLPCFAPDYVRLRLYARNGAVAVFNRNPETLQNVRIAINTPSNTVTVTDMDCREWKITATERKAGYAYFTLPELKGGRLVLIRSI